MNVDLLLVFEDKQGDVVALFYRNIAYFRLTDDSLFVVDCLGDVHEVSDDDKSRVAGYLLVLK